jgi:CheY-like chemotaxis protein
MALGFVDSTLNGLGVSNPYHTLPMAKGLATGGPSNELSVLMAHHPCDFRDQVIQVLEDASYTVEVASDSPETLLRLCKEDRPKPDILIIEKDLPGRDAIETMAIAGKVTKIGDVSIILLKHDMKIDERVLKQLQIKDVLTRPTAAEVLRAVQRLGRNKN